jgi:small-conductance mechanosensitive channel
MVRIVIGSIVGGLAQFFIGFLFWGTPLSRIVFTVVPDAQNAAIQAALAQNLSPAASGTYHVPWPETAQGLTLHGKGPVALIFYNPGGFPLMETGSLIGGLVISILSMLMLGLALHAIAARVTDFATRARIVVLVSLATAIYFILGQPVFNFYLPWGYWIYLAISLVAGFCAGGLVLARWFVPYATVKIDGTVH